MEYSVLFTVVQDILQLLAILFVMFVGLGVLFAFWLYIVDRLQKKHAIRHNFPLIGRFRYVFESLGEFFRQYFFAMDREELPFNRAERAWVYRAAKKIDTVQGFGSTHNPNVSTSVVFVNSMTPVLEEDILPPSEVTLGPDCDQPYTTRSLINISGMSYGAISKPAIRALSNGAYMAKSWLNTGEGGLSRFHLESGCDVVFQIGTAKYGVSDGHGRLSLPLLKEVAAHPEIKMFEIKISQGAKPGHGGILPARKVTEEIAKIRQIPEGVMSVSPNRHVDIATPEDLLDMIDKVRTETGRPVGFKAVMGDTVWFKELCEVIHKRGIDSAPDFITLDGGDGGSGAAPRTLMDYVGLQLRESLPLLVDLLVEAGLRDRIKVISSGKLINPAGLAWALCVGADFVTSARGFLFALGCIQALKCHLNECPTGITTHKKALQRGLDPVDKAERVRNYIECITDEVGVLAHSCGVPEPRQLRREHVRVMEAGGHSVRLDTYIAERLK
ncbi:MAG: FMN-binding glutamate synthase family protein [Gammaproteobacteria bacterium]